MLYFSRGKWLHKILRGGGYNLCNIDPEIKNLKISQELWKL